MERLIRQLRVAVDRGDRLAEIVLRGRIARLGRERRQAFRAAR